MSVSLKKVFDRSTVEILIKFFCQIKQEKFTAHSFANISPPFFSPQRLPKTRKGSVLVHLCNYGNILSYNQFNELESRY